MNHKNVGEIQVISEKAYTYNFDLKTGKKLENNNIFKDGYKAKLSENVIKYFNENENFKTDLLDGFQDKTSNKEENLNKYAITKDKIYVYFDKYEILPGVYKIVKAEIPYTDMNGFMAIKVNQKTNVPESNTGMKSENSVKYTDVNETVYAKSDVHIRQDDSTASNQLGTLKIGESITRIGIGDNGWSKVKYNEKDAYIYTIYLTTEKPENKNIEINKNGNRNIDPSKPMVALTFDDGPNPNSTPRIIETLQKNNAVATFFDLGSCMASYPSISQKEEAIGCEVQTHTYSHKNLNTLSQEELESEMEKAKSTFETVLGRKPTLIRPPYGNANSTVRETIPYPYINWDIDTLDWKTKNVDSILSEIRKYSNYDGRIILMHSIYGTSADAVETIVPELISKGYQLVTVSELAKYKGVTLEKGKLYYDFR